MACMHACELLVLVAQGEYATVTIELKREVRCVIAALHTLIRVQLSTCRAGRQSDKHTFVDKKGDLYL